MTPVLQRLVEACGGWLNRRGLFVYRVNQRPLEPIAAPLSPAVQAVGVRVTRIDRAICERAVLDPQLDLDADFVARAFARGDVCHAALVGSRVVAFAWRSTTSVPHLEVDVVVPAGCSYGYKSFTLPDYRGRGLYAAIAAAEIAACTEQGIATGVSITDAFSPVALRADRAVGNRTLGWAGFLRVGQRTLCFRTPAVARMGFRFVPARAAGRR